MRRRSPCPNPASIALHESIGFEPIGALRDIGWKEGAWRDVGYWQLYLRPPPRERPTRAAAARADHLTRVPSGAWQITSSGPPARTEADGRDAGTRRRPRAHPEVLTEEDVYEALEEVIDPELGLDFVSLGLVYDVAIEKEDVYVTFTLTTPACPIGPQVSEQMKEFVGDLPGVSAVHPKMVFDPAWSPEMMTEDAKFALGF